MTEWFQLLDFRSKSHLENSYTKKTLADLNSKRVSIIIGSDFTPWLL